MEQKRIVSLDALRGVAALSVVVWHWQHFFALSGAWEEGWRRDMQPFFWLLKPLYVQGWAAVDLFFVLSGFVFFWLYGDAIRERRVGAGRFALLRFARLYPLHLALLLAAAVLQALYLRQTGTFFIYQANDAGHFIANIFMVQAWWRQAPQTFDGPAWSVSIEVLLYVAFFAACRMGLRAGWMALAAAMAGASLLFFDEHIGRGVVGFFMGGCAFAAWRHWRAHRAAAAIGGALGGLAIACWVTLAALLYRDSPLLAGGEGNAYFLLAFDVVICPLSVLALALRESSRGPASARLAFLGDISYSTYLIHFPLQLCLVLIAARYAVRPAFFMQGWVMLGFYAILIALGALSYRYFERPMQAWLRGKRQRMQVAAAESGTGSE